MTGQEQDAPPPADDAPAPPAVGEIRTWTDRIDQRHQGRVTAVEGDVVVLVTAHGATARVGLAMIEPPAPEVSDAEMAAERLAAVGHAKRWLDDTLPKRLEDCVTGAWDALTSLNPDAGSDYLKVSAAQAVADAAQALAERVRDHVNKRQQGAAT